MDFFGKAVGGREWSHAVGDEPERAALGPRRRGSCQAATAVLALFQNVPAATADD